MYLVVYQRYVYIIPMLYRYQVINMVKMLKVALKNGTQLLFGETNYLDGFNIVKSKSVDDKGMPISEDVLAIVYIDKVGDVEIGTHRYIEFKDIMGLVYSDAEPKIEQKKENVE